MDLSSTVDGRASERRREAARSLARAALPPLAGGLTLLIVLISLIGSAVQDPRPHDIAVGVVGPAAATQQLQRAFDSALPGAFRLVPKDSEASARSAVDSRDIDGALILGGPTARVVVAGAAGDAVAGAIAGAFTNALRAQGTAVTVETVHPFSEGDAHGLILFFLVVAMSISSLVVGPAVLQIRDAGAIGRLAVVLLYGILAGLVGTVTAAAFAGGFGEHFWEVVALTALVSLAVGAPTAACARVLGAAGIGLAALVLVLLSVVSSGGPLGSSMLPDLYRTLSPWLPAAEAYSALRGSLYFAGAGVVGPVLLLATWAVAGMALVIIVDIARPSRSEAVRA